jgi:hypothetical protein
MDGRAEAVFPVTKVIGRNSPCSIVDPKTPVPPTGVFSFDGPLSVGERRAPTVKAGKLIDRVAAGAPVRQLFVVQTLGHSWMPFPGVRADHRAGVEPAAIDAMVQRKRRRS